MEPNEINQVICILGSPRREGNTDRLAREFLRGVESQGLQTKTIIPTELGISWCDGGNQCFVDGQCIIRDGMNDIYDEILATTHLVVATPVYFMGPPGSLKAFIDRFQAVWARTAILKTFDPDDAERRTRHKAFAIIAASSDKPKMIQPTLSILKAFFNVIGFTYSGELIAQGIDRRDDIIKRTQLLAQAYQAGASWGRSQKAALRTNPESASRE